MCADAPTQKITVKEREENSVPRSGVGQTSLANDPTNVAHGEFTEQQHADFLALEQSGVRYSLSSFIPGTHLR